MAKILEVKNLQVSFRTQGGILKAVRDISFDLEKGETLAIVGESGSGKSVTSKAIIGILAGNSIVEGGEILYDGKDLLKISEDDFHKIRGDKIAMIFQDPLSSLNPIVRIGKQLTEAMILNGKARQKNAKKEFHSHLTLLNTNMDKVLPDKASNALKCKTFNGFCILSTKLERDYNQANDDAITLNTKVEELIFLFSKNQKIKVSDEFKYILKMLPKTIHPNVVKQDNDYDVAYNGILNCRENRSNLKTQDFIDALSKVNTLLKDGISKEKPNFFRLGYYKMKNPNFDESSISVKELDKLTKNYLDDNFMLDFINEGKSGIKKAHDDSIVAKKIALESLKEFKQFLLDKPKYVKHLINKYLKPIEKEVFNACDNLSITKYSVEHSFKASIEHEFERYFYGVKNNPISTNKYNRRLKKYNRLVKNGKNPTWKVLPPTLVDLYLSRSNIHKIIDSLIECYNNLILSDSKFDAEKEMIDLVDFEKEQASRVVYTVSKGIAKAKAIELLTEVGIAEPQIRYKQYPFEFSGGMRQRIVIAIALSANPDILICDEPTTALDVTIQSQILELINKIKKERNLSVIFITHDLGVVANMADRIAVMYAGKIVEYGTCDDIFYDPRHPYTWALLSSMPDFDTKEKLEAIPGTPPNMIYPPVGDAFAERNKYALEIDFEKQPPLFEVSPTHFAATWLLHPNAPKVEMPKIITERINRMKNKEAK